MKFKTFKIDLSELDEPELWVEVSDPGMLPWGFLKKIQKDASPEMIEEFIKKIVVDWNFALLDGELVPETPNYDDYSRKPQPLPIPKKDINSLDYIPSGVLTFIVSKASEETKVPKR